MAVGRLQQEHHIRGLPPTGGDQHGAGIDNGDVQHSPSEMLLAALGSCLSMSIHANAVARAIPIRGLEIESSGDVDPTALWGTGAPGLNPLGFETISVRVHIDADAPRDVLKVLVDHAVLWSPVANTLHNPVHLDVVLA